MKYFFWTFSITLFVAFLVTDIYLGSGNDIYFKLKEVERPFYINRGTELGLYLDSLNNTVLNKRVILHSIKRWTPLTTNKIHPHISKLVVDKDIIFNEIKE